MNEYWLLIMNIFRNPSGITLIVGMVSVLGLVLLTLRAVEKQTLVVRPGEVAVIVDPRSGTFADFWPSGRYWKPTGIQTLKGTISTRSKTLHGSCEVHTEDGYQVALHWNMNYHLNPDLIDPLLRPSMANILLSNPTRILELQTRHCLQKIVGLHTMGNLQRDGIQAKINCRSTRSASDCLAAYGIVVENFRINAVIWPPENILPIQESSEYHIRKYGLSQITKRNPELSELVNLKTLEEQTAKNDIYSANYQDQSPAINHDDTMAQGIYHPTDLSLDHSAGKLVV